MNTKIILLAVSGIISVLLLVLNHVGTENLCVWSGGDTACISKWFDIIITFIPILPLFLFSLITFFMREHVFRNWARFALPGVALSMLLTFLTPEPETGGFGPQIVLGKSDTALVTSALFVLISVGIIVGTYIATRSRIT